MKLLLKVSLKPQKESSFSIYILNFCTECVRACGHPGSLSVGQAFGTRVLQRLRVFGCLAFVICGFASFGASFPTGKHMPSSPGAGAKRSAEDDDRASRAARRRVARDAAGAVSCSAHFRAVNDMVRQSFLFAARRHASLAVPLRSHLHPPARASPRLFNYTGLLSADAERFSQAHRLRILGCGMLGLLCVVLVRDVRLHARAMQARLTGILRRVAARRARATPEGIFARALQLCVAEKYSRAAKLFEQCAALGVLRANAELSWLLLHGRKGLYFPPMFFQQIQAFQCAAATSRLGCVHSSGVLSYCLMKGVACRPNCKRAVELARSSSESGSRFGHFVMGELHRLGLGGCVRSNARALHYFHLAAAQGLDSAQCSLGDMYSPFLFLKTKRRFRSDFVMLVLQVRRWSWC